MFKNFSENISKAFRSFFYSDVTRILDQEKNFIKENDSKARKNLTSNGWQILSVEQRVAIFGYKAIKFNNVVVFTIREALNLAPLVTNSVKYEDKI
jgi:hypothetical protein